MSLNRRSINWLALWLFVLSFATIFFGANTNAGRHWPFTKQGINQANINAMEDEPDSNLAKPSTWVRRGVWGGEHIGLTVRTKDAKLEYDCAHGTIDQPMKIDGRGRFSVSGTHTWESGGPDRGGRKPDVHPARYSGTVNGTKMVMTVTLKDTNKPVGTFTLAFGDAPDLFKCK